MKIKRDDTATKPPSLYDSLDLAKPGEFCQHRNRDYYQEVEKGKDGKPGKMEDVCIRCSEKLTAMLHGGVVITRREEQSKSEPKEEHTMALKIGPKAVTKEAPAKEKEPKAKKVVKAKGDAAPRTMATGKRLKLGINQTWVHLFQENEKLAKAGKAKTDEEISEFMYSEFAPRKSKVFAQVATVRSRYNRGLLTQGDKPKTQSEPYNKEEKPEPKKKSSKK